MVTSKLKLLAAALATAGLLAACGGGGGADTTPKAKVTSVKVMGDSLSDSGTFGFKFTVQGNDPTTGKPYQVWTERIAGLYNTTLCPHYGPTMAVATASCTNYAIGGATFSPQGAAAATAMSIYNQIKDAGAAGVTADDLILIDGGANDAADLITAVLTYQAKVAAGMPQATAIVPLQTFLLTQIDAATLGALLAQGSDGLVKAGGLYMQTLAKKLTAAVQTNLLGKGATRVAILNIPAISMTPKFTKVLTKIANDQGAAASAQAGALLDGWVNAFNAALSDSAGTESRIAVVDFYTEFKGQISNPAQYNFTNSTVAACGLLSANANENIQYCSADALSAAIPVGETSADWWKHYVFANDFHPTPYGYQQMSQLVSRTLAQKGWL